MPQHNWVYVSSLRFCLAFLLSTMASNLLGQRPGSDAADSPAALPNIVLIVSDDQGYPDLGCIGSKPIRTPNLDRLAAEGVRATSFYVTWPACTPSRGSLLTGRYPQRNGLYDMVRNDMTNYGHRFTKDEYEVSPEMTLGLDPKELTIGDMLKKAGYVNAVVGKWDMDKLGDTCHCNAASITSMVMAITGSITTRTPATGFTRSFATMFARKRIWANTLPMSSDAKRSSL